MFAKLRQADFWVGVIVVVIALRWLEKSVPAVRAVTNPGMSGS